jgi:dTDP-glucose 4,6-dehydratase
MLGWTPQYGGLDGFRRGLLETIAWFSEPAHLAMYKSDIYNL